MNTVNSGEPQQRGDAGPNTAWHEGRCPICDEADMAVFCEILGIPTSDGRLWRTQAEARKAPTGDLRLAFCRNCGYIGNQAYDPRTVTYNQGYNASLGHSPRYRQFLHELAHNLVDRYSLRHKTIIEIGCGNGEFLRLLCHQGQNRGLGFDPTPNARVTDHNDEPAITFIQDFYSEQYAQYQADFICCRHLLSSVLNPRDLVSLVKRALHGRADALAYFEMPDLRPILQDNAIWNLIYEHCSYFTEVSLARLFTTSGFDVCASGPCFEGQYLGVVVRPTSSTAVVPHHRPEAVDAMASEVAAFAERYRTSVAAWRASLETGMLARRRVVAWGAGGRAISFLSALKVERQIEYVVDVNPDKQHTFLPGTGQQIVPPTFLIDYQPEVVIITNVAFEQEIRQQVRDLALTCEFLLI